ncbi:hypothetical protein BST61_g6562 [Cercospora zeina]
MARLSVCIRGRAQGYIALNSQLSNAATSFETMSCIRLGPELPYGLPMERFAPIIVTAWTSTTPNPNSPKASVEDTGQYEIATNNALMPPHTIDCWQPPSRHSWPSIEATTLTISARPPTPPPQRRRNVHLRPHSIVECDHVPDSTPLTTATTPPPKHRRGEVHVRPYSIATCDEILGPTPITTTPTTTTTSTDSSSSSSYYRPRSVYIPSSTSTLTTATTSSSGGRPSSVATPTVPRCGFNQAQDYNYNIVTEALRRTYSKAKSRRQQSLEEKASAKNRNSSHFVNSYSSFPRYRRDSKDVKAPFLDDKSSSRPHVAGDKASSLLYDYGAEDAAPVYDADPMAQRLAAPYIVSSKFFKQYDVRRTSDASAKNLEICQNGMPVLFVNIKTPFWGVPRIDIVRALGNTGAGRGGPVVAAAKFKQIASGFYINIGHPPDAISVEQWPQVSFSHWNEKECLFEFEGRRFTWRSPVSGFMEYLKDNGDLQLVDLEDGTILAAYIRPNKSFTKDIARIEVMVELDQDLELMALTAIMAIDERKRRAMIGASCAAAGAAAGAASS